MARILKKIPNFKLPKYKMRDIEDIEELNIEYTPEVIEGLKKKEFQIDRRLPGNGIQDYQRDILEKYKCVQRQAVHT